MKKTKTSVKNTYDAIAEDFDITRYKPWPDTIKFAERFSPGQHILDLGCGNGRDIRHFQEKGLKVTGLDISSCQLLVVRERSEQLPNIIQGDVASLPLTDNLFDGAICVATLHHLPEPAQRIAALKEIYRVLKPGGLLLLGVWASEQKKFKDNIGKAKEEFQHDWEPGDMLLDWKLPDGRVFQRYYHLFSEKEFDDLLATSKFEVESKYCSCDNHYAILRKES